MAKSRRRFRSALAAAAALLVPACTTQDYYLDYRDADGRLKDINLPVPEDLDRRLARFRSGEEKWHSDPLAVADLAIREHLDVPWKADRFRPDLYELKDSPERGTHVVRGYVYPSGHEMRYRVTVRPYQEIWYPVQVSRYKRVTLPHPALDD